MVVLDISESGAQIGEKLFELLNPKQRNELKQYVELKNVVAENVGKVPQMLVSETGKEDTLLDIKAGDLYASNGNGNIEETGNITLSCDYLVKNY